MRRDNTSNVLARLGAQGGEYFDRTQLLEGFVGFRTWSSVLLGSLCVSGAQSSSRKKASRSGGGLRTTSWVNLGMGSRDGKVPSTKMSDMYE